MKSRARLLRSSGSFLRSRLVITYTGPNPQKLTRQQASNTAPNQDEGGRTGSLDRVKSGT